MALRQRKLPPGPRLKRQHGSKKVKPALLIVCEGKTEKVILTELRACWGIASVRVMLVGQAGVPSTVVECAANEARRNKEATVWVVFDRDEHPCWSAAIDRAHAKNFRLGISNPCVELWGLLLHYDQFAALTRQEAQRKLSEIHPGYDHDKHAFFDLKTVLAKLESARVRADALLKKADEDADAYKKPTTRFHKLVARLHSLAG